MKIKKYNNGGIVKLQNAGKVPEAVVTAKAPSINTAQGRRAAKNMTNRLLSRQDNTGRVPVSYYNYVTGELNGAAPTRQAINTASEELLPYVIGTAFGPAGAVATMVGEAINTGVNAATKGDKDSWGDLFINKEKHPIGNTVMDFTNPGYLFLGTTPKPSNATNVGVRMLNGETSKQILNSAKRIKLPKSQFVSEIKLDSGNYTDTFLNDAVKIAESAINPGKMSNEALSGVKRMKIGFQSDGMKKRLKDLGYNDAQISQYIQDRLAGLDLSKTSVAENLTAIRPLEARTNGALVIKPGVEVGYGQNFNGLGIQPFDQQFIQITKSGNVKDIISHEIGGHGTEKFNFTHDLSGNPIYSKTKLTPLGKSFGKSTGLGESYYLNPAEQRARFIVTAQDMVEQGFDPNNYDDFLKFVTANQSTPISTNAGQTARFYDIKTLGPAFSKAHGIIPIGTGIGLGTATLKENKVEN